MDHLTASVNTCRHLFCIIGQWDLIPPHDLVAHIKRRPYHAHHPAIEHHPPLEMARMVKDKVASGAYATESEVVREGIRALQERDAVVERWLHHEVAPSYDAHKAHPERAKRMDGFINAADQQNR